MRDDITDPKILLVFLTVAKFVRNRLEYLKEGVLVMDKAMAKMPRLYKSAAMHHVEECVEAITNDLKRMIAEIEEKEKDDE
jgi:hypothetical protein